MDRYKAFRYLDEKTIDAFKLIPIDDRKDNYYNYTYNEDKNVGRYKAFKFLKDKSDKAIELVRDHNLYDQNDTGKLYRFLNNDKFEKSYDFFSKEPKKKIIYVKKNFKANSKIEEFENLEKKTIDAFKYIPEDCRKDYFKDLDKKNHRSF